MDNRISCTGNSKPEIDVFAFDNLLRNYVSLSFFLAKNKPEQRRRVKF